MGEGAAIVGIGETRVGRHPGRSALDLQCEAVRKAVADAGIDRSRIDGVYALGSYIQPTQLHGLSVIECLGLRPRLASVVDVGGTVAFIAMIQNAMAAIDAGRLEIAVCVYGDNAATHRPPGTHGYVAQMTTGAEEFEEIFGSSIVVSYALLARRYLDHLRAGAGGGVCADRARPRAATPCSTRTRPTGRRSTIEDYRASPWIAEPFRRLDCSPVVDGAGAFVIVSRRVARGARRRRRSPISARGRRRRTRSSASTPDIPGARHGGSRAPRLRRSRD